MTNSKFASKLINVFFATSKGRFCSTYIAISVNVFFLLETNYFFLWNFFLLRSSFSSNDVNNFFFAQAHFYRCWRYFQIPRRKEI